MRIDLACQRLEFRLNLIELEAFRLDFCLICVIDETLHTVNHLFQLRFNLLNFKIYLLRSDAKAFEHISNALKLNPQDFQYYVLAGNIYEQNQDIENAISYYNEAFEIYSTTIYICLFFY